ncbi:MAG: hypothetical protein H8E66_03425 [Planctomycetes bacterium]|nr:hypothetical protein [Planctomycetota bacterium]
MIRKTLISTFAILALAALAVSVSLNDAYSEDEGPTDLRLVDVTFDIAQAKKPSLRELRAELIALRADMQKVLALLQRADAAPANQAEARITEVGEQVTIFQLEFVPAYSVAEVIQSVALEARVSVLEDENRLIVAGSAGALAVVTQTIEKIDQPRQQVQIESYLFEIAIDDLAKLEILERDLSHDGTITGSLARDINWKATIDSLSANEGARLLARPNIRAYDRTAATFQSVQEIPVQQLTQTSDGANIGTTEFREAGITMEVTPRITSSGKIIMEVHPEFSVMQGFVDGQPVIDRRSAMTTVVVKDDQPIVISGLRSQRQQITDDRIEPTTQETELLILMKAKIIDDRDE